MAEYSVDQLEELLYPLVQPHVLSSLDQQHVGLFIRTQERDPFGFADTSEGEDVRVE
jgi:hypothetical protein